MKNEISNNKSSINYSLEEIDQRDSIPYKKSNHYIAGTMKGAILLAQIVYWYGIMGFKPFYKFKEPCDSPQYKVGQSWSEELGLTKREFDAVLKTFGKKIKSSDERDPNVLVHFWVDFRRLTFYEINMDLYAKLKNEYYEKQLLLIKEADLRKEQNVTYDDRKEQNVTYVNDKMSLSYRTKCHLAISESTSEITSENVCVVNTPTQTSHTHTNASLLTTNPECLEIFNFRFSEYDVVIDELADACIKFYAPKEVSVLTFKTWIRREKIDNFQKKGKSKVVIQHSFTEQEQDIAGQYRQAKRDNLIENWYPNEEKREQARLIFERVYKCPN